MALGPLSNAYFSSLMHWFFWVTRHLGGWELGIFLITCLKLGWSQLYLGGDIAATPTQTQLSELL